MRIFLDANVLFSGAKSDGAVRQLLKMLVQAGHECWVDGYVLEEARRNLAAKAPDHVAVLDTLHARWHVAPVLASQQELETTRWLPDKDRPVLAAAIRLRCAALVTGDRTHFGAAYGKSFGGVTIHSPQSLAQALLK